MESIYIAAGITLVACITDLKTRRIPNVLTFGAAGVAIGAHAAASGVAGLSSSVSGWLLGIALFFPFFALRGLGAGDVKLLGAIGAWTGPALVFRVALYAGIAGGVLAVIVALHAGYMKQALTNILHFIRFWKDEGFKPVEGFDLQRAEAPKLAYALPILTGVLVTIWLH